MEASDFKLWLKLYGQTWEDKNPERFSDLFVENAEYFRTPFEVPKRGMAETKSAFEQAVSTQQEIKFSYEILSFEKNNGICRWWCKFVSTTSQNLIRLDGILVCSFDKNNKCKTFREWWHKNNE